MNIRKCIKSIMLPCIVCIGLCACKKENMHGRVSINFSFSFEGQPLVFDSQLYKIASGNAIKIDNIQYFVSNPVFIESDGTRHGFSQQKNKIHYVDSDIPATLQWEIDENLPAAVYHYVEFVYGLDSIYNHTGMFVDAPESLMFWPEAIGGGYHHMKLNGWYAPTAIDTLFNPFGFHGGRTPNAVRLTDTVRIFLTDGLKKQLNLNMETANWFRNPNLWDFQVMGGSVMQNDEAQRMIRENACDVFTIK